MVYEAMVYFYSSKAEVIDMLSLLDAEVDSTKLKQVASGIQDEKLKQVASEMKFPSAFAFVPWMHHVLIIQKSKSIEEALFFNSFRKFRKRRIVFL